MLTVSPAQMKAAYAGEIGALGTQAVSTTEKTSSPASGPSFASHLAASGAAAIDTLRAGEAAAIEGMKGNADTQAVVQAVMSAELTLQTAVAVRDKMVSAYMDIMRMPV